MKILYIGDVMGEPGVQVVEKVLPELIGGHSIDIVIAQAENVTEGKGLSIQDYNRLRSAGVQAFTSGNWTLHRDETNQLLEDEQAPVTRPANYPEGTPGKQYKFVETEQGRILIISLLGSIVGRDADKLVDNPLRIIDQILNDTSEEQRTATVVNLHGDFSSEKRIIGYYLDGRVTAVVGDHWHVPTADAMILPLGTAHMTDVGMCGTLHSSLGIKFDSVIPRWRDNMPMKNELETKGPYQFNAALIEVDDTTKKATSITHVQKILSE